MTVALALARSLAGATGATAPVRHATFEGRDHLVVPIIAMVEGLVHAENASEKELVRAQELAIAVSGWNGRPVVLGHPSDATGPVSANGTPELLEQSSFGRIFNAHMQGMKLAMDAWLDPVQAAKVGPEAVDAMRRMEAGELVDVSVGVFMVPEVTGHGTRALTQWTHIVPDHLAILPRGVPGACSLEMGCGAPRAAAKATDTVPPMLTPGERVLTSRELADVLPNAIAAAVKDALRTGENPGGTNQYGGPYSGGGGGGGKKDGEPDRAGSSQLTEAAGHATTAAMAAEHKLSTSKPDLADAHQAAANAHFAAGKAARAVANATTGTDSQNHEIAARHHDQSQAYHQEKADFYNRGRSGPTQRPTNTLPPGMKRDPFAPNYVAPSAPSRGPTDFKTDPYGTRRKNAAPKENSMLDNVRRAVASIIGKPWASRFAADELSDTDIREQLSQLLRATVPGFLGVEAVFPDNMQVVYAAAPEDHMVMARRTYTSDPELAIADDEEAVHQVTSYEPIQRDAAEGDAKDTDRLDKKASCACGATKEKPCTCHAEEPPAARAAAAKKEKSMKERTKELIKHSKGKFTNDDAEWLDAIPAGKLKFIAAGAAVAEEDDDAPADPPAPAKPVDPPAPVADVPAPRAAAAPVPPVVPAPAPELAPLTSEEWLAAAPPEIRALVDSAKADQTARKTALLAALKGKTAAAYTDAELATMSVDQLSRIAKLVVPAAAPRAAVDYSGITIAPPPDPAVIPPAPSLHARVLAAAHAKGIRGAVPLPPTVQ